MKKDSYCLECDTYVESTLDETKGFSYCNICNQPFVVTKTDSKKEDRRLAKILKATLERNGYLDDKNISLDTMLKNQRDFLTSLNEHVSNSGNGEILSLKSFTMNLSVKCFNCKEVFTIELPPPEINRYELCPKCNQKYSCFVNYSLKNNFQIKIIVVEKHPSISYMCSHQ